MVGTARCETVLYIEKRYVRLRKDAGGNVLLRFDTVRCDIWYGDNAASPMRYGKCVSIRWVQRRTLEWCDTGR